MKKQHVIALVVAIVVIILICLIMILSGNKSSKEGNSVQNEVVNNDIDWENIEVTTIKFKLKNSTGKDISKIYMRNNLNENFTDDLAEDIKNGEEKEVEYGNYSPYYSWDMKFIFADGTEKALNSMLAANQLYNEATLELVELGDNIDAVNHDMATFDAEIPAETTETAETTEPAQTEENTEESNPGNEEAEVENVDETTPSTEESVENEEVSEETENAEENSEETTEETAEETN